MSDCLFCKIAAAQIPVSVVAETKSAMAFRDIDPQAPTHVLVIPREHFANAQEIAKADPNLAGELLALATQVADQVCFLESGLILERGTPEQVLKAPSHQKTKEFLKRVHEAGRL